MLAPGTRHAGPPTDRATEGRNRGPRLTARDSHGQEHGHRGHAWGRRVPATPRRSVVRALAAGPEARAWDSFPAFRSFPLCYTAGRHEGARRGTKIELMNEPADRAVVLLQRVSELLLEPQAIVQQLEVVPNGESSAGAADRIAYGILVTALEGELVTTIRHALDVLKRFRAPAGILGEQWLREQEGRLGKRE